MTFVRQIAEHIVAIDDSGVSRFPGGYDYYLEKQEERNLKPETGNVKTALAQDAVKSTPGAKGKDARKVRAQQREAEKVLRKIEGQIDTLTKEQTVLTEEMMSRRDADFAAINTRLAEIQKRIQQLESEWETTVEELGECG